MITMVTMIRGEDKRPEPTKYTMNNERNESKTDHETKAMKVK